MACTAASGTPALAESETKVWRRLWKEATTLRRLRPAMRTFMAMFARLKMRRRRSSSSQLRLR